MNREVRIPRSPRRIVSLVPSQTELLYDLGVGNRLNGLTKFCVHPNQLKEEKVIIGGTKDFKIERIKELQPDLIIGNKEENDEERIASLEKEFSVWMSDIETLADALNMIEQVGEMVDRRSRASELVKSIVRDLEALDPKPLKRSIYLIWHDPIMAVGKSTFINDMLKYAGFQNLVTEGRYPALSIEELKSLQPDYILLSSEPFPFKKKHEAFYQDAFPNAEVILVNGEMFSWYGSRLLKSASYFDQLQKSIH